MPALSWALSPISDQNEPSRPLWIGFAGFFSLLACLWPAIAPAQDRSGYILGERQGLEMMVHIIGEVQKPGEYRVTDRTDVLELVSKAGGPTPFSRLSSITVRRVAPGRSAAAVRAGEPAPRVEILRVNLEQVMRDREAAPLLLMPGDVVLVPKNGWHRWREFSAVARDISVVASAYFLYVRATKD